MRSKTVTSVVGDGLGVMPKPNALHLTSRRLDKWLSSVGRSSEEVRVRINPGLYSPAAAGKQRLMLYDTHIRADVCLDNQDPLRVSRLRSDELSSKVGLPGISRVRPR